VPRVHISAAAWIEHMQWLNDPTVPAGKRNAGIERARSLISTFIGYEDRWDFLLEDQSKSPVLLPPHFREWAQQADIGLPKEHPWIEALPKW